MYDSFFLLVACRSHLNQHQKVREKIEHHQYHWEEECSEVLADGGPENYNFNIPGAVTSKVSVPCRVFANRVLMLYGKSVAFWVLGF